MLGGILGWKKNDLRNEIITEAKAKEQAARTEFETEKTASTAQFDRDWALHLIQRSLTQLESAHAKKPKLFQALKPWIDEGSTQPQKDAAESLDISPTALKVALHRLRKRFRELVRMEIAQTIHNPNDLEAELHYLISVVAQQ